MFARTVIALIAPFFIGSVSIQSYICQPPETPVISSPVNESTVSGNTPVVIKGSATADTTVTLTDNDQTFATLKADQNKSYAVQTQFAPGSHLLDITTTNPCGTSSGQSVMITAEDPPVVIQPTPSEPRPLSPPDSVQSVPPASLPQVSTPKRQISNMERTSTSVLTFSNIYPQGDIATKEASLFVTGKTNKPATEIISLDEEVIARTLVSQRSFGINVPLKIGENTITITARTKNEKVTHTFTVTREAATSTRDNAPVAEKPWYETTSVRIVIITSILLLLMFVILVVIR